MTFSFLYPLFWLGALAIAAPIWLHLRRKAETSLVRFSALQFLDDMPQARSSPLRLQDPLLFLLRVLALLLLIAAFAWPFLANRRDDAVSESRIYILDNTLSHRVGEGVARDRKKLVDILEAAPADAQIAVIELTSLPRVVVDFSVPRAEAIARVSQLQPSYQRGSYLAAFRQAAALFQQSLGAKRRIEFLTDSQANQWDEATTVAPFLEGIDVVLPEVDPRPLDNVAVASPRPRRLYQGDKSIVECDVTVVRHGDVDEAEIAIEVDGREVDRRSLKFAPETPPRSTIVFRWDAPPRAGLAGSIVVTAPRDALDADNRVVFSLPEVREGKVTAVSRSPFLRAALSPEVMQGRWAATWGNDSEPASGARASSTDSGARDADVLVIESRFLMSPTHRELVDHYLARERGVLVLVDHVGPPVQAYLRGHGVEFRSIVDQPVGAAAFRYVMTDHPIFDPFQARDFGNLLDIQVHRYRRLAAPSAQTLVYSQHGDLLLAETDRRHGKLLVAAFGVDRAETNWPLHPTFVPFLDLCLEYLRARPNLQAHFEPAERCVWSLPPDLVGDTLVVRAGEREWLRQAVRSGRVEFSVPDEPGLYQVSFDGGRTFVHDIHVNPNPLEAELTPLAAEKIVEAWRVAESEPGERSNPVVGPEALSRAEILRQNLWWWLLIAGAMCLVVEMVFAMLVPRTVAAGRVPVPSRPESGV